ncbi:MAG TPA: SRPBCC family protein, partial [Acidimicrobiales bacterium]|nr:SRPBCC family protein [Acidimicrobiales bacterium]
MHDSVTVHMAAPADRIFELVSDVTQIGKFSPETFEAEWLDGATGPAEGAHFRGHVKRNGRGPTYWTTCTITACEPGRDFAFAVGADAASALNTWSYHLEPAGAGTDVTESFQLKNILP